MRILMVCLGNICRSPLAHGIFEHLVREQGLDWVIESAGTGDWHRGQGPDPRAIQIAQAHGVDISQQRAQHFTEKFFEDYDHIFVMDHQNYEDVLALARTDADRAKVRLFLPDKGQVQDPYFDDALFKPVFDVIQQRALALIEELKNQSSPQKQK